MWSTKCKRCGIGSDQDYCSDCQRDGHDPELSNYKYGDWNVFEYGDWSDEHGMYEEIRELTRVTEEVANDYILSSNKPMCAYLIGPFGNAAAKIFNERGLKCYRKSLNTKLN